MCNTPNSAEFNRCLQLLNEINYKKYFLWYGYTMRIQHRNKLLRQAKKNPLLSEIEKQNLRNIIKTENKVDMRKYLIVAAILLTFALICFAAAECEGGNSRKSSSSRNSGSGGFIGSDGEYHAYVPEFGDDVNNWMENNW